MSVDNKNNFSYDRYNYLHTTVSIPPKLTNVLLSTKDLLENSRWQSFTKFGFLVKELTVNERETKKASLGETGLWNDSKRDAMDKGSMSFFFTKKLMIIAKLKEEKRTMCRWSWTGDSKREQFCSTLPSFDPRLPASEHCSWWHCSTFVLPLSSLVSFDLKGQNVVSN